MRGKILLLSLLVGLLPLVVTSWLFYEYARSIIVADRVEIYLKHLSQQNADKIDLFLTERREEGLAMASNTTAAAMLSAPPTERPGSELIQVLNDYVQIQEVYDLMVLVDRAGRIRAVNNLNRFGDWFDPRILNGLLRQNISTFPEEARAWQECLQGQAAVRDWYYSGLVHRLYYFDDDDACRSYHLLFAQPVRDPATNTVVGVWLNIMNWEYIQAILDLVESDFNKYGLHSGYSLLLDRDGRRVLAAPARKNRKRGPAAPAGSPAPLPPGKPAGGTAQLGLDIAGLPDFSSLRQALQARQTSIQFSLGGRRFGGVAVIGERVLAWRLVISLDEGDIFKPVQRMGYIFVSIIGGVIGLILIGAWLLSRNLIRPLRDLQTTALDIARGNYSRRLAPRGEDEIAVVERAFNQMASMVEERRTELQQVNQALEEKVRQRTRALESGNIELRQTLQELRDAQGQLVQSEKMASLGRLIAGIAHEIKNPLNFIYGNTQFLDEYITRIHRYVGWLETHMATNEAGQEILADARRDANMEFVLGDLRSLAANFHEGAERIKTIVDDLRAFSRAGSGTPVEVDLGKTLDMCLNLLRNQYKNRIRIHREYGETPPLTVYNSRMEQVFLNLLTNAIQAIPADGDIWIRTRRLEKTVQIEIEDSGPGIPEQNLSKIFEPFFTTKEVGQGTGLGLSISYSIVQQHGGSIRVCNRTGSGGAVFQVELPLNADLTEGAAH